MVKNKFSVLVIIHNEEKRLETFFENMKLISDDIIVVHDGICNDKSIEISKKYTNKIYEENWTKSPEFLKVKYLNKNLEKRIFRYDYLLSIDADETFSNDLIKEIKSVNIIDNDFYWLKIKAHDQTYKESKFYPRLFNIHKIKFFGFYHTGAIPLNTKKIYYFKNIIIHDKYLYSSNKNRNSLNNWVFLEASKLIKKEYNFYNFSKLDRYRQYIRNYLKLSLILRFFFIFYLYINYTIKYSHKLSIRRMDSYIRLSKYIFIIKKHNLVKFIHNIINFLLIKLIILKNYFWFDYSSHAKIIITVDDEVTKDHINILKLFRDEKIPVVFFIPFENFSSSLKIINSYISKKNDFEIGWHGYYHTLDEFNENYKSSIKKSIKLIKLNNTVSMRFPFLRKSVEAECELKNIGIKIDSSKPSYFPLKENDLNSDMNFLRLPPYGSMDLQVKNFSEISNYIKLMVKCGGTLVLPFHIFNLEKNHVEFKKLIIFLKSKKIKFQLFRNN